MPFGEVHSSCSILSTTPVSGILWFWHKVFSLVSGSPDNGVVWALSVVFLVFTLKALLFKPFVKQVRTQLVMQKLQPQIKALQKKYSGDRQKLTVEMAKLQKEHNYSPLLGCLPMLVQAPVFIGLYHVLRSFNRTGAASHVPFLSPTEPMSVADNANTANYFFSASDVQSFLDAKLFGAPLSAMISSPAAQLEAFGDVQPYLHHSGSGTADDICRRRYTFHIAGIHRAPSGHRNRQPSNSDHEQARIVGVSGGGDRFRCVRARGDPAVFRE